MNIFFKNVDEYIQSFPENTRKVLMEVRRIIQKASPEAEESISYGMPAYKTFGKPLVYFAAFKSHIGFYATPSGHAEFAHELSKYKQGKGSVQFPIDKEIPFELIKMIVEYRVQENIANFKSGKVKKIKRWTAIL